MLLLLAFFPTFIPRSDTERYSFKGSKISLEQRDLIKNAGPGSNIPHAQNLIPVATYCSLWYKRFIYIVDSLGSLPQAKKTSIEGCLDE